VRTNWTPDKRTRHRENNGHDHRRTVSVVSLAKLPAFGREAFPIFSHRTGVLPLVVLCLFVTCLAPTAALAHARWFINDTQIVLHPEFKFDGLYLAMLVGAVLFMLSALTVEMARGRIPVIDRLLGQPLAPTLVLWRLLSMIFGATLVINSMAQVFVAPNLAANGSMVLKTMLFLQILIGGMFFVQARLTWACAALLLVPILCAWEFSTVDAVDYAFELVAIGLAVMLMAPALAPPDLDTQKRVATLIPTGLSLRVQTGGRAYDLGWAQANPWRYDPRDGMSAKDREALAIAVLRTLFGLQLIVLAAHDKMLEPGVSLAFVDKYSFVNIPALLGASQFTNLHFVFGAGLAEITFGSLLIANVAVRATCVMLLGLFTTTAVVFGIEELVGHLPIIAMLMLLAASGSPKHVAESSIGRQRQAESSIGRWQIASLSSAGAAMMGLIGIFAANGIASPGLPSIFTANRIASSVLPSIFVANRTESSVLPTSIHESAAVPAALYKRFAATASSDRAAVTDAEQAVRDILINAKPDKPVNKDKLAASLFALSIQYETIYGSDSASQWLRYAHLTASCSLDDVQTFRKHVASESWRESVASVHDPLADQLLALARPEVQAILKRSVDPRDPAIWTEIATQAPGPDGGPDYVHTHNLAAITRIIYAVARDTGRYPNLIASAN
jgi:hypothetical protein